MPIPFILRLVSVVVLVVLWACPAGSHDPSSWGGLFRSRDGGARWLPLNARRFIGGALGLAISPSDSNHLLLATDSGLLRSRNAGRDWQVEAPEQLVGAVFAAAFGEDGVRALASTARGLWRTDDGATWWQTPLGPEALPARGIVPAGAGRVYLAGATGVWRSDDWGASWVADGDGLPAGPVTAPIVTPSPSREIWVLVGGRLWRRADGESVWRPSDAGMPQGGVNTAAPDPDPDRLWAFAANRLYRSDDRGRSWAAFGRPLPQADTSVRGIAAALPAIVLATHLGLFRSQDGGASWELQEGMLPVHLEAGMLARDPADPATLYAGFAITPYDEMWRMATQGGTMLGRLDTVSLAGGAAFLLVVGLTGVAALRRLGRHYTRRAPVPPPAERAR